jgi:hypothetical protein
VSPRPETHSEGSLVELGRLCDQLPMEEDSQAASATAEPINSTVSTYRA